MNTALACSLQRQQYEYVRIDNNEVCFFVEIQRFQRQRSIKNIKDRCKKKINIYIYTYVSSSENDNRARGVASWTVRNFAVVFYTVKIADGIIRRQYAGERKITIIPCRRRERPGIGRPRGVGDWSGEGRRTSRSDDKNRYRSINNRFFPQSKMTSEN